jgi:hypothetical protein
MNLSVVLYLDHVNSRAGMIPTANYNNMQAIFPSLEPSPAGRRHTQATVHCINGRQKKGAFAAPLH